MAGALPEPPATNCAMRKARRSMKSARSPDSRATLSDWFRCRRVAIPRSSNCTSNRDRFSNGKRSMSGIVTAIAAPATLRIEIEGEGGHAGAVLMPQRRDAFLAAAEIALAVEQPRNRRALRTRSAPPESAIFSRARSTAFRAGRGWRSMSAISMGVRRDAVLDAISRTPRRDRGEARRFAAKRSTQRRSAGDVRFRRHRCARDGVPDAGRALSMHDQPGLSRFAFYVADRADCNAVHSLPRRGQPSAGRILFARGDCEGRACAC